MTLRDGARTSLWQDTTNGYIPTSIQSSNKYDVVIAGGGITGLTTALLLQNAGKRCIVLEAQSLGFGTTGGTTAHINTMLDTPYSKIINDFGLNQARIVADSLKDAIALVKENIKRYSIQCNFSEEPGYIYAQNEQQEKELTEIHDACVDVGVSVEYTSIVPLPIAFTKAIKLSGQAKFHPLRYINGLASAFEDAGGVILEQCRVLKSGAHPDSKSILNIETTQGNFQALYMMYATHSPIGVNLLHLRTPAIRSYAMAVKLQDKQYPKALCYDMYDPYHYYRTQEIDGEQYLIVGGDDHKTGEEKNTNGCFLRLESHVRTHFNVAEIAYSWSSQLFESVDGLPYIGHLPGNPDNVFVATGFAGNGITLSQVAALTIHSQILRQQDPYESVFSPTRLKPVAGFTEFIKHNADVVKQFVGKRFEQEKIEALASLAPGEAKLVRYEGHSMALYKDEMGNLHGVSPSCTHMKCSVDWNSAEKSWDCPCHGARYSFTGEVLNAPANHGLEPIEFPYLEKKQAVRQK